MRPFLVCIHDATPAYSRETRIMIRDLAPLVQRRLALGVVPNWHGKWPLGEHPEYCELLEESAEDLLLHGYFHRRERGWGPVTLLTERSDEMNGLDSEQTRRILARAQLDFIEAFGEPARGFLAPAWQRGRVSPANGHAMGLKYALGFFSLDSSSGRRIPLSTWTWDCSRWQWTAHVGHAAGWALHSFGHGVPTLAIHPRDLERGFWPKILRLTGELLDKGYEPTTLAGLLEAKC